MRHAFVTFAIFFTLSLPNGLAQEKSPPVTLSADEKALLEATNQARKVANVPPLKISSQLLQAARTHSATMARLDKLAHELENTTPVSRAEAAGYKFRALAENCAAGQRTPQEAIEGWLNSPGHRTNLLNAEYTEIGLAVVAGKGGIRYWTQVFGKPIGAK